MTRCFATKMSSHGNRAVLARGVPKSAAVRATPLLLDVDVRQSDHGVSGAVVANAALKSLFVHLRY